MIEFLRIGSRGAAVKLLQALLNAQSRFALPRLKQDGTFGLETRLRVIQFQRANGLRASGIVDRKTWEKLITSARPQTAARGVASRSGLAAAASSWSFGARAASSDPEWKYVNVRRLMLFLEHSLDQGTQWTVFEPEEDSRPRRRPRDD